MLDALSDFVAGAGAFAPLLYISLYLATALLPFIPTPLVSALGGSLLGFGPAVGYGVIGLGLGAFLALRLSRSLGRPVIIRLVGAKLWEEWEELLGIRSPFVWGIIFFVLNIDFAVVAAGLSGLPLWQLWLSAVVARLPWLVLSAFFGENLLASERLLPQALMLLGGVLLVLRYARPRVRRYLVSRRGEPSPAAEQPESKRGLGS